MFVFDAHVQKFTAKFAKKLPVGWFNFHVVITGQGFAERPHETATGIVCSEADARFAPVNALILAHHAYRIAREHNIDFDEMIADIKSANAT